jgi:spore coat polysaccharide biosynthesis protein SpsF
MKQGKTKLIAVIIQARMGSKRLPGKVMKLVNGRPLLSYMIERVKKTKSIDHIIIATTNFKQDDVIIEWCKENNINYYRGSAQDVLSRYFFTAKKYNIKTIVRLTADCPLIDPVIIDKVVYKYIKLSGKNIDFVSNSIPPDFTYPDGMEVEVFNFDILREAYKKSNLPSEREHVTFYFWKTGLFSTFNFKNDIDYSKYRLTVDYEADFIVIKSIIENLYRKDKMFFMKDMIHYLNDNISVNKLQKNIVRNSGWEESLGKDMSYKI